MDKIRSEVNFAERKNALTHRKRPRKSDSTLRDTISTITATFEKYSNGKKWHLIQNQPLLREIYKEPPLMSYRKGKSLKDMLVKAKL